MKRCVLLLSLLGIFFATLGFAKTTDTENDQLSYTLGYSTGQKISQGISDQNAPVSRSQFAAGLSDAVNGKSSRLSSEQMQKLITDFQNKMMFESQKEAQKAIEANRAQLVNNAASPVDGNPKGKVTLIEFFDYQCVHCRRLSPNLAELKKQDGELRIVYKEFPIFGETSTFASKAALAAKNQGKYQALHDKLLSSKKPLTQEEVLKLAKEAKINIPQLKKDMQDPALDKELQNNRQLAQAIGINATPALIFTTTVAPANGASQQEPQNMDDLVSIFIPGAAPIEVLQQMIGSVSKKAFNKAIPMPPVHQQDQEPGVWQGA
ncbi:MAG: dsbA 2 [Gammaproteobacteria bacterium]|jgi:protein-disulfide isomerase|nr:dsbA 2 [Gammaproteobacteria bacterium]